VPAEGACDQAAGLRGASASPRCRTLAVASGKGGVGKTSLAVNLALAWAQAGRRTCLLDGDLGLANVDVLLNLHPPYSLRDVVAGTRRLEDVMIEGPAGLRVIPSASGVEALADLDAEARSALLSELQGLDDMAEIAVVDTGAGISRTVLSLILATDEAVIVTTPEPTALTDAYALVKVLTQRRPGLPLYLAVNQVAHAAQAREVHGHMERIVRRFLRREIPLAGGVPRDGCVERAVREQRPFVLYFPYARASEAIQALARTLEARRATPDAPGQFWTRLAAMGGS